MVQFTEQLAITVLMGVVLLAVIAYLTRVENWRTYAPVGGGSTSDHGEHAQHKPAGIVRWLTTVDHKDLGILYGLFAVAAFAWGGVGALIMRMQLFTPGANVVDVNMFDALMTTHGITMLFLFGSPIIAAFANYFVPLLIDADDMAYPRINAIGFWLLPPAALLIWGGFFLIPFGLTPSTTSWTMYVPLAIDIPSHSVDLMLLGLHLSGIATTLTAINMIVTIITQRSEDVSWANLDIFSWTVLTQSGIVLFAFPLLGAAIIMLLLDRTFGLTFFADAAGGPILWQHLFWFFGHPEVYILVLPPMGLVSLILPRFSGRKLFGFKFVVYSTLAIGVLSFGVWAHHMFSTGIDPRIRVSFMAVSLAIAVPSAVKTFNWIATMWNGRVRLTTPMLFMIGFVANFIIGGVTGVFLAAVPIDMPLTDTYYVVGHFHYIVMGVIGFAVFGGIYYWFPMITGRMYDKTLGKWHFWLSMVGSTVTFFPMLVLGQIGMPRRYATYQFGNLAPMHLITQLNQLATIGAFLLFVGQAIWLWNMWKSWHDGPAIENTDPWDLDGAGLRTREWEWFAETRITVVADGGEEDAALTDGDVEE